MACASYVTCVDHTTRAADIALPSRSIRARSLYCLRRFCRLRRWRRFLRMQSLRSLRRFVACITAEALLALHA